MKQVWRVLPDNIYPQHHSLFIGDELRAWVYQENGQWVVDCWGRPPPPHGPFETLEAAKLAAETLFG